MFNYKCCHLRHEHKDRQKLAKIVNKNAPTIVDVFNFFYKKYSIQYHMNYYQNLIYLHHKYYHFIQVV